MFFYKFLQPSAIHIIVTFLDWSIHRSLIVECDMLINFHSKQSFIAVTLLKNSMDRRKFRPSMQLTFHFQLNPVAKPFLKLLIFWLFHCTVNWYQQKSTLDVSWIAHRRILQFYVAFSTFQILSRGSKTVWQRKYASDTKIWIPWLFVTPMPHFSSDLQLIQAGFLENYVQISLFLK